MEETEHEALGECTSSCSSIRGQSSLSSDILNESQSLIGLSSLLFKEHMAGKMMHDLVLCFCCSKTKWDQGGGGVWNPQRLLVNNATQSALQIFNESKTPSFLGYCCSLVLVFLKIDCFGCLPQWEQFGLSVLNSFIRPVDCGISALTGKDQGDKATKLYMDDKDQSGNIQTNVRKCWRSF